MLHVSGQGGRIMALRRPASEECRMHAEIAVAARSQHMVPRIAEADARFSRNYFSFLAGLALVALLSLAQSGTALAATAPPVGTNSTFGVVDSTYTNTQPGMTITGDLCYTTAPALNPTLNGTLTVPCNPQQGIDENTAKANIDAQICTAIGAAVALDTIVVGTNPPGTFPPGCYSSTGTMTTTGGTTVTLNGYGIYIFRSGGAISTAVNSNFRLIGGACASDVYWSPTAATTLGANTTFVGTILDVDGITMESLVKLAGKALAFGATVTTDADTITVPALHCPSQLVDAKQADFNGDGKADILWRNVSGEVYIMLMNGLQVIGQGSPGTLGNDWQIAGVGDFNGDGKSDILWRNNSGEVSIWLMNGTSAISKNSLGIIGNDWRIAEVGDFNGDGKSDILWRNDNGGVYETWMNGINLIGGGSDGIISNDWQIE